MSRLVPVNPFFGLGMLNNALDQRANQQRQGRLDQESQARNALAMQVQQAQLQQLQEQNAMQGRTRNALRGAVQPYGPFAEGMYTPQNQRPIDLQSIGRSVIQGGGDPLVGMGYIEKGLSAGKDGFTLGQGQTRYDAQGNLVASGPSKPGKQIERTVDLGDKVEYIYTDGTRENKPKSASPNTVIMGNTKTPKMEMDMRKEFTALPEVKAHVEISSQIQRLEKAMEENARGGSKVAVDQALITILNKMLDPSSVVRESEYARTPGDLAFLNRMRGKIEKLKTGGAGLTDEDRAAIADMARNFATVSQSMYDEQANYYGGLAERYGYNPENVVRLGGAKKVDKKTDPLGIR